MQTFENLSFRVWQDRNFTDAFPFMFSFTTGKGKNTLYQFIASTRDGRNNENLYLVVEMKTGKILAWRYSEDNASKRKIIVY